MYDNIIGDFDSDSGYVTNHPDVVSFAKRAYQEFPTIVNIIPKSGKKYDNTLENFALVDNTLAKAQMAIGTSSNLAQLSQTYMNCYEVGSKEYNEYRNYTCVLSVLAQVAIDNAKRSFDCDLNGEIARIRKAMKVDELKFPKFWEYTHIDFDKKYKDALKQHKLNLRDGKQDEAEITKALEKGSKINLDLKCPMNIVANHKFDRVDANKETIPNEYFFKADLKPVGDRKRAIHKIEGEIVDYSLEMFSGVYLGKHGEEKQDAFELLEFDFDILIQKLQEATRKWTKGDKQATQDLCAKLLARGLNIDTREHGGRTTDTLTRRNQVTLVSVLYGLFGDICIDCFCKNIED